MLRPLELQAVRDSRIRHHGFSLRIHQQKYRYSIVLFYLKKNYTRDNFHFILCLKSGVETILKYTCFCL